MTCKACGLEHRGWVTCVKAKHDMANTRPVVIETTTIDVVANEPTKVANRHGVYKDKEKRLAYMRELMRKRRAK